MQSRALVVETDLAKYGPQDVSKDIGDFLSRNDCRYLGPNAYDKFNHSHTADDYQCRDGIYVIVNLEVKQVHVRVSQEEYFSLEADHLYSAMVKDLQGRWPGAVKKVP